MQQGSVGCKTGASAVPSKQGISPPIMERINLSNLICTAHFQHRRLYPNAENPPSLEFQSNSAMSTLTFVLEPQPN